MRRRVVRHFALYLPSQVGPAVAGLVSVPILARALSPSDFGLLALALASVAGGRLLFGWIQSAAVRFYAAEDGVGTAGWLRTALWVHLSVSLVLCAAVLATACWWVPADLGWLVVIGVCVFFERNLYGLLTQFLRARLDPASFTGFVVWESAGGLLLGAALAYFLTLGPEGVLAGYFLAGATALPRLWRQALPPGALSGSFSLTQLRRMAAFGMPLTVSQLGTWALRRIDRFLIQAWYGAAAVGSYTVPYLVAQNPILLFGTALHDMSVPLTAEAWERRGHTGGLRMLEAVTRMYLLGTIPMVAGISVLARPVLHVMGGAEFSQGWNIIPWVAAGAFFFGLHHRFVNALLLAERTGVVMVSVTAAAFVNIALNWWLLPRLGYEIAAVTAFLSYALLTAPLAVACWRYVPWSFPWRSAGYALVCTAGMTVVLHLLRTQLGAMSALVDLVVSVPIGALAYAALLWATGESDLAEWKAALVAGLGRARRPS